MRAFLKYGVWVLSILCFFDFQNLLGSCCSEVCAHQIYIGPEVEYARRTREGGSRQDGILYGARAGYDFIRASKFYFGLEGLYLTGRLHGHSADSEKIKSNFRDAEIEGRLGFTFMRCCWRPIYLTPFFGGGYVDERNNFVNPSPLKLHYDLHYGYVCAGFLSTIHYSRQFDVGLNFKAKYMLNAKNDVTHDPDFDDTSMHVKNEFNYRLELPLTYRVCDDFYLRLVPFYEYRHYGGKVNFPFDFIETRMHMAGATLKFVYCI